MKSISWAEVNFVVENWRQGSAEDSYAGASRDVDEAAAKVYFCFATLVCFGWWFNLGQFLLQGECGRQNCSGDRVPDSVAGGCSSGKVGWWCICFC